VGAAAFAGANAFFSDTETSTGNVLSAGSLDLRIDSTAHYDGMVCTGGVWVDEDTDSTNNPRPELIGQPCSGSWTSRDLTQEQFFNLSDVKPGDTGENTISLLPVNNKAWACVRVDNLQNNENTRIGPEIKAGDTTDDPQGGELAQNVFFTAWADTNGDNKWNGDEPLLFTNQFGPASDVLNGKTYALADSLHGNIPLDGNVTKYIGLQWCAGTMTVNTGTHTITCDGAGMGNNTQTDSMTADMHFYVEQFRNNSTFNCNNVVWTGPTGASGASGATGVTGPSGATGASGVL
jgi:hypothetical protein